MVPPAIFFEEGFMDDGRTFKAHSQSLEMV